MKILNRRQFISIQESLMEISTEVELAELLLPELTKRLERKYPSIYDPDLIDTAVADAILNYCRNPYQYRPKIRSLLGYLQCLQRAIC